MSPITTDSETIQQFDRITLKGKNKQCRILLITMPLADPYLPNLAIEQLAEVARANDYDCDVFYGTLHLSPAVPLGFIHSMVGPTIFGPVYHRID